MKKFLSLRFAVPLLGLLLSTLFLSAPQASGQVSPGITKPLHRFLIPSNLESTFLTTDLNEGYARGYSLWDGVGGVVVPPFPGWVPVDGQGLAPMYRWRVDHVSGTNYYYSGGLWPNLLNNPENHLEGITAYALMPGAAAGSSGIFLHLWYSQSKGYFYGASGSATFPPGHPPGSYNWQGVAYRMIFGFQGSIPFPCNPQTSCFLFQPPPPPPSCNPTQQEACINNGGNWNTVSCTCSYPPPPNPCREFELLDNIKTPGVKENKELDQRPPICRQSLPS